MATRLMEIIEFYPIDLTEDLILSRERYDRHP